MGNSWGRTTNVFFWDDTSFQPIRVNEHCLCCIPLRAGTVLISVGSFMYGIFGLVYSISFAVNYDLWKTTYENKLDLLVYIMLIITSIPWFLVTSIILLCGVLQHNEVKLLIFLWSTLVHVCVYILINIAACVYCLCKFNCFGTCDITFIIPDVLVVAVYAAFWWYMLLVVNEVRIDM